MQHIPATVDPFHKPGMSQTLHVLTEVHAGMSQQRKLIFGAIFPLVSRSGCFWLESSQREYPKTPGGICHVLLSQLRERCRRRRPLNISTSHEDKTTCGQLEVDRQNAQVTCVCGPHEYGLCLVSDQWTNGFVLQVNTMASTKWLADLHYSLSLTLTAILARHDA